MKTFYPDENTPVLKTDLNWPSLSQHKFLKMALKV